LIFSDGTGQVGGYSFDEDRTNVYKLYRATRVAPDSCIDPLEQAAFYDPGLGSRGEGGFLFGRTVRWIYKKVSQATGLGLTRNIIKCYAAIIRLAKPGDRIFLFGFSRGAYTVRCIASVLSLCGIPTQNLDGSKLPLDGNGSWKLAKYAVKHIYQFTPSRKVAKASYRQQFLLQTRDRLAIRFRMDCRSFDPQYPIHPNNYPYFVGAFDTVAALGNLRTFVNFAALYAIGAMVTSWLVSLLTKVPLIGSYLELLSFCHVFISLFAAPIGFAACIFVWTHVKFDFRVPGYSLPQQLLTLHPIYDWKETNDTDLNFNIPYAKHAIAIDENRRAFARVNWGVEDGRSDRDNFGNLTFEQVWFPGNHADIGGGYPENESRLSDTALKWMLACAYTIPNGIKYDRSVLRLHSDSAGIQHDEVKSGFGTITDFFIGTWPDEVRELLKKKNSEFSDAPMHRSVYERFDMNEVPNYDAVRQYRPITLAWHLDFKNAYVTPGVKSNPKRASAATYIEPRLPPNL
jgi:uncharacterized protein (DUF2235 family)